MEQKVLFFIGEVEVFTTELEMSLDHTIGRCFECLMQRLPYLGRDMSKDRFLDNNSVLNVKLNFPDGC